MPVSSGQPLAIVSASGTFISRRDDPADHLELVVQQQRPARRREAFTLACALDPATAERRGAHGGMSLRFSVWMRAIAREPDDG